MNQIESDRACRTHGRPEKCIRIYVGESEENGPLGRTRHRWEDNIKINRNEVGSEVVDKIHISGYEPVASCCEHGKEPSGFMIRIY
jgi:hypothetical protein